MRHLFIINPAAGKRSSAKELVHKIESLFNDSDESFDIFTTTRPLQAIDIADSYARKYAKEQVRIYACGGDGTLNEVVTGAHKHLNCAVGAIPVGSGNDFVKSYEGLKKEDFLSLERMVKGNVDAVDLITVDGDSKYIYAGINIVSIGFDAEVAAGMQKYKRIPFINGSMAYNLSVVQKLFTSLKHKLSFEVDGKLIDEDKGTYLFAIAANGKWYGGGFKAAPIAELSDGLLDFTRVDSIPIYKIASLISTFRKGEHLDKLNFVKFIRCRSLKIFTEKYVNVNIDGEVFKMQNPTITLLPKAMRMIVPAPVKL